MCIVWIPRCLVPQPACTFWPGGLWQNPLQFTLNHMGAFGSSALLGRSWFKSSKARKRRLYAQSLRCMDIVHYGNYFQPLVWGPQTAPCPYRVLPHRLCSGAHLLDAQLVFGTIEHLSVGLNAGSQSDHLLSAKMHRPVRSSVQHHQQCTTVDCTNIFLFTWCMALLCNCATSAGALHCKPASSWLIVHRLTFQRLHPPLTPLKLPKAQLAWWQQQRRLLWDCCQTTLRSKSLLPGNTKHFQVTAWFSKSVPSSLSPLPAHLLPF